MEGVINTVCYILFFEIKPKIKCGFFISSSDMAFIIVIHKFEVPNHRQSDKYASNIWLRIFGGIQCWGVGWFEF
jgi:hypothetical protein